MKSERPERILAVWPSALSTVTSCCGMEFMMAASFLTGSVISPASSTSALMEHLMPSSRLVVVSMTLPPSAIWGFELTTFVTCLRPVEKCSLLILNFMLMLLGFRANRLRRNPAAMRRAIFKKGYTPVWRENPE